MLDGGMIAAARMAGGLLGMAGRTLLGTSGIDDIFDGDAGADASLSGCSVAGVTRAEAGGRSQMAGIDAHHVGQGAVTGVAQAGNADRGVIGSKDMAHWMALGAGVGIAITDGGNDNWPITVVACSAGVAANQMHALDIGPGGKGPMAGVTITIGCDVVGLGVGCMALGTGIGVAIVDGGDDLGPGAVVAGGASPAAGYYIMQGLDRGPGAEDTMAIRTTGV